MLMINWAPAGHNNEIQTEILKCTTKTVKIEIMTHGYIIIAIKFCLGTPEPVWISNLEGPFQPPIHRIKLGAKCNIKKIDFNVSKIN